MFNSYTEFVKSLVLDIRKGKEVSFLFGSAVSSSPDGKGVPNVSGMNDILRQYMIGLDIYDGLESELVELSETDKYQRGFEYLLKVGDQDDVKEVMSLAMDNARNGDKWHITKTLNDFSRLFTESNINVKCILTTNFDPLIEEALLQVGRNCNVHNLIIDQPINSVTSYSGDSIPVVHLHGVWDGDTMHTQTQLAVLRKKIELSIKNILDTSKLYVIGYAGWDDVFLQALKNIMHDFQPSYNVRWAFYKDNYDAVYREYTPLIDIIQPALANARFQGYLGVDCNNYFKDALAEIGKKKQLTKFTVGKHGLQTIKENKGLSLRPYNLSVEPAHDFIRLVEQKKAIDFLTHNNNFELVSGCWGYGKAGFLYSFIHDEFDDYICYYSDVNGLIDPDAVASKIKQDIGVDIAYFISNEGLGKRILILDNIARLPSSTKPFFNELATLSSDLNSGVKVIFVSTTENSICSGVVSLQPLSVDDIKEYVKIGTDVTEIKREKLDRLYEISNGIPLKLDKVKEYNGLMSFDEILDAGSIVLSEGGVGSDLPHYVAKQISEIKSDDKKLYSLLCIFSILEYGERLTNIRSHYSSYNFRFEDFAKLERFGLIYTIIKDTDKILRISPVVSDFVKQGMEFDERYELVRKSLDLCIGSDWMSGTIRVSPTMKMMLENPEFYPGNVHSAISTYFSLINIDDYDREVKALIHASIGYCFFLKNSCYYKELVAFSRMLYSRISHFDILDKYRAAYFLTTGLRMIDELDQCVEFIEPLSEEFKGKEYCQNDYYYKMLDNILLACAERDVPKSLEYASKLKKISPKSSSYYINAESHLANKLPHDKKVNKLIALEKKSRAAGYNTLANNISIKLHHLLPTSSFKYINKAINNEGGVYTKARALLVKYEELVRRGEYDKIDGDNLRELRVVYDYLFSQRLDDLFNRCTDVLWQLMKAYRDIGGLYYLFKRGSVIWRVTSLYEKELEYAKDLNEQELARSGSGDDVKYLTIRLHFLVLKLEQDKCLIEAQSL
ncbi:SIR2 family protein [Citrobacter freundii]